MSDRYLHDLERAAATEAQMAPEAANAPDLRDESERPRELQRLIDRHRRRRKERE